MRFKIAYDWQTGKRLMNTRYVGCTREVRKYIFRKPTDACARYAAVSEIIDSTTFNEVG